MDVGNAGVAGAFTCHHFRHPWRSHVVARCVRRAWLWGKDDYAGRDYSHRKEWIIERLAQLTSIFTIEVCAYAVMSNHYHLVVYIDQKQCKQLSTRQIVQRWMELFSAPPLVERWLNGTATEAEHQFAEALIEKWRHRLCDLSWFMKCLNEHLARRANAEDNCDGRFWQGRFRSQALLDEAGLLTAMAYVDLNPIRAGIAKTPEDSEFTSIFDRIKALRVDAKPSQEVRTAIPLRRFTDEVGKNERAIPYTLRDYLALVDWSGRVIRNDKRGAIGPALPPILNRLGIEPDGWKLLMGHRDRVFGRAMGKLDVMRLHAATLGQSWVRGVRRAERIDSS